MSDNDSNAFAGTPPEWVPLRDLPALLERRFDLPPVQTANRLRALLQDGTIRHRVGGSAARDVTFAREIFFIDPDQVVAGPFLSTDPVGFEDWLGGIQVGSDEWETVGIDWSSGTVAGRCQPDGARVRLPIEIKWRDVEKLADGWKVESQPAQCATEPANASERESDIAAAKVAAWMMGYAEGFKANGKIVKREDAIRAATKSRGCSTRVAEAAYEALPHPELRNPPRARPAS